MSESVEEQMARLIDMLMKEKRMEDLSRMTTDKEHRKQLLAEMLDAEAEKDT
ncbi:MAG: hypothetical protein J6C37_03025 [Roseburia sp.]|nr:hypothetical protein [Roseburia sp.]